MSQYTASIQALYVAYFNRPADPAGLAFWEGVVARANGNTAAVSAEFAKSPEYKAAYAGLSADGVINQVYLNIFGRTVDSEGLNFWSPKLQSGAVTIDQIVTVVAKGAQGSDLTTYNNRTTASIAYTDALNADVSLRLAYSNAAAITSAKAFLNGITTDASLTAAIAPAALSANLQQMAIDSAPVASTQLLTAGVDTITGTSGNDVFNAAPDALGAATFTPLDTINGGAGNDTLNIISIAPFTLSNNSGITLNSVENIVIRGAGAVTANTTGFSSVSSLKSTQSAAVNLTAGESTSIQVLNATGNVVVNGGSSQNVTATAANTTIDMNDAGGAISATHKAQGTGTIDIDGGTSINLVAEGRATGAITIGAAKVATGAINVSATGVASAAATNTTLGTIAITGGTTVVVNEFATSDATAAIKDTTGSTVTLGAITVNGAAATTSVTVNQATEVAVDPALATVAGVKEVQTVTFSAMTAGQAVVINGLTFTAVKDLTAIQAASAFANLGTSAVQGSAPAANGIYSNAASSNFTTGAAVAGGTTLAPTATVTFTASTSKGNVATLISSGTAAVVVTPVTDGDAGVAGYEGTLGVVAGAVAINGNITGTDVLSTVSLNSFANSTIASDALTSLSLANSTHNVAVTNTVATSLNLSLNNIGNPVSGVASTVGLGSTYTNLNITTAAATSRAAITASAVETLAVSGTNTAILSGSSFAALKTVTVSGAAGLTMDASGSNVTSVDSSATTGTTSVTINTANATFTGGAGTDSVTLLNTTTTKAVTLGAGNDTLRLATGTTALTANMDGGIGTDTLRMDAADAATASATTTFATKIDGFEKLQLNAVVSAGANTVDLANLDNINYVISTGTAVTVAAASEVQTLTVSGTASGAVSFLGAAVAGSVATDDASTTAGRIVADKAAIMAAWNAANPTREIGNISNVGAVVTVTYLNTEGNVANLAAASSAGISFTASTETTPGVIASTAGSLTLTHVANAATLEMIGAGANTIVTMNDATGTADSLNIVTKVSSAAINFGDVAAAGVETINLTVTDTVPTSNGLASIQTATLNLTDAALKSVVITGNSNLTLSQTAAALTSVDGSAMTGILVAGTNGTVSQTIKGGAAADVLTANGNADVLIGGAGADTLIVGANGNLAILTGGAGNDVFNVAAATTNVNSYATITDFTAGDKILFNNGTSFIASKVSLGDTAVFQDYANAAIASTNAGQISWFQIGGNTYVIENVVDGATFTNDSDVIVKLVGLVDLGTGSFNATAHTLLGV